MVENKSQVQPRFLLGIIWDSVRFPRAAKRDRQSQLDKDTGIGESKKNEWPAEEWNWTGRNSTNINHCCCPIWIPSSLVTLHLAKELRRWPRSGFCSPLQGEWIDWLTDQMTDGVDGHDLKWSSSLLSLSTDDNQIDGLVLGASRGTEKMGYLHRKIYK